MKLTLVMDTDHLDVGHTQLLLDDRLVDGVIGFCAEARADVNDVNLNVYFLRDHVDQHIQDLGPMIASLQMAGARVRMAPMSGQTAIQVMGDAVRGPR
jgi:hypothetical protein